MGIRPHGERANSDPPFETGARRAGAIPRTGSVPQNGNKTRPQISQAHSKRLAAGKETRARASAAAWCRDRNLADKDGHETPCKAPNSAGFQPAAVHRIDTESGQAVANARSWNVGASMYYSKTVGRPIAAPDELHSLQTRAPATCKRSSPYTA